MNDMRRRDFLALGTGVVTGIAANGLSAKPGGPHRAEAAPSNNPIRLDVRDHGLRFRANWCDIPDWRLAIEVGNEILRTTDARVEVIQEEPLHAKFRFPKRQLTWEVQGETDAGNNRLLLRSTIRNESQKAVPLGRAFLLQTDEIGGFFKAGDDVVYLPMSSGQELNQVRDLAAKPATSDIAIQAFNQNQNKALQVGFVTFLRAKTRVEHNRQTGGLQLRAWCDFDGWELQPGSSTPTETLTVAVGEDPHSQLESWGDLAARLCHVRPREWEDQPNGWIGGAWVD